MMICLFKTDDVPVRYVQQPEGLPEKKQRWETSQKRPSHVYLDGGIPFLPRFFFFFLCGDSHNLLHQISYQYRVWLWDTNMRWSGF